MQTPPPVEALADSPPRMRNLMPPGYLRTLMERTGKDKNRVWDVVNYEKRDADIWPAVLELAEETRLKKIELAEREAALKAGEGQGNA